VSTVGLFHDFQRIHGFCPCCGAPFRLNDATLYYKAAPPKTPWDSLEAAWQRLQEAEDRFLQDESRLREKATVAGRLEADRRLEAITVFFKSHDIAIGDIKLLFHPVDYVLFRGLSAGGCTSIEFIDREPISRTHERLQRSIETTIKAGHVSSLTARIRDDGRVSCSK
jgi:predicted Holliday junction resolvase-like endonuclease